MSDAPLVSGWITSGARLMNRHQVRIAALPERAYRAMMNATLCEMLVVRLLFSVRGIPFRKQMTVRQFFTTAPFLVLEEAAPHEVVFGLAASWSLSIPGRGAATTPDEWRSFTHDGVMRAVGNFRVAPAAGGSTLSTETWVETFGRRTRWLFRTYWAVIGPFSGLTRREFLRVAKRRAEAV